jgi:2-polyprenyl-3-methyl-5-hydroxy-6-metoxy-1,4-benzoquinol methylase
MPVHRTCPICETAEQHRVPYRCRTALRVQPVICKSCGLVFVNPMYVDAEKEAAAPSPRALHRPVRQGRPIQRAHERELRGARRFMGLVGPHLKPGDRVLDIGCGDGALLRTLQEFGAAATGIDLDPEGARFVEETYGIPVVVAPFETSDLGEGQFDAIVATHVIEHVFEPVEAMRKIRRLLKPEGLVVLETPNILRPKVGFGRMFSVPHNYYFSPRTLCRAMERAGFAPLTVWEYYRDSFVVAARATAETGQTPLPPGDAWQEVARRILAHDFRYKASLQFLWRKIPGLKAAIMYRVHREIRGEALARWLAKAA